MKLTKAKFRRFLAKPGFHILLGAISIVEVPYLFLERLLLWPAWGYQGLRSTPNILHRYGGNFSYGRWCHIAGVFHAVLYGILGNKADAMIVDVGCGTGGLFAATDPFVRDGGKYLGIDVSEEDIAICRRQYPFHYCAFAHHEARNAMYAPDAREGQRPWSAESGSADIVMALSVWTHLTEADARFYFKEVERIVKPGGHAVITACVIDDIYARSAGEHFRPLHVLDTPMYGSREWRTITGAILPEHVVGITDKGIREMAEEAGMELVKKHPGYWKCRGPRMYIQDILIFRKK